MGRKVDVDDLVSLAEVAERLNLTSREAIRSWHQRYSNFRQPVAKLGIGLIFYWPDIEKWARATGRPRGYRRVRS